MIYNEKEVFHFIFNANQFAIESKWRVFCADTVVSNLEWAYRQYKRYDEAITFFNSLVQGIKDGIIDNDNAFRLAFQRYQEIMGV